MQTGTTCLGGLTDRESHYILRMLAASGCFVGMDLVELNPSIEDPYDDGLVHHGNDFMITGTPSVRLSVELCKSALGNRLLR